MAGLFGRTDPPRTEVSADRGALAVGRDIRDSLIKLGLDEEAIASLLSGTEARLLAAISGLASAHAARAAGVEARAFVLLARKINEAVDDEAQALAELEQAISELARLQEAARRGSNLDALVNEALRRVAEKARRGAFDEAADEAGRAFEQWQGRERERRERERADGLRLVEANVEQHRFRRDAKAMAMWVERGLALEADADEAPLDALKAAHFEWWLRGMDKGLNLDLEVAVVLAEAVLRERTLSPDERGKWLKRLGDALKVHGERAPETARLEEAVRAYNAALEQLGRECAPLDWAATQDSLAGALTELGEREAGTARLKEAVVAYETALLERTRDRVPLDWARTQNNLGNALSALGEREAGTARLEEAVAVYRAALEEWTRERVPLDSAMTTLNRCFAEALIAKRLQQTDRLAELEQEASEARQVLVDGGQASWADWGNRVLREIARNRDALGGEG